MKKEKKSLIYYFICLYVIMLPFSFKIPTAAGKNINADYIFILIIITYMISLVFNKGTRQKFIKGLFDFFHEPVSIFMMLLLASMIFSISYSLEKVTALKESIRFCTYIILFFIIKYDVNEKNKYVNIMICVLPIIVFQVILGIIQGTTGIFLNEKFIYKSGEFISKYRITGTFGNPNTYGAYLILFIFPLIMLFMSEKNKRNKLLLSMIVVLMFINILLTFSRNAWLGFAIGILILIILYSWKLIWLLLGVGLGGLFIPKVHMRLGEFVNYSQNDLRFKLWKIAAKIIKKNPIKGIGNGNYVAYYDIYTKKYPELKCIDHFRYPVHNSYLKVLSELGVIGFIPFMGIILSIFVKLKSLINKSKEHKVIFIGILASLIVFMIMNLFDNLLFVPKVTAYFWIIVAICDGFQTKLR
ncbi:O-antigen ligase family protein [Clostridium tepidiprofundi]|uniref:O-antigen ligase family protein n=1 Tax=Clostridium tepidiprofundi TaxID=420412 RepID=UPI000A041351|nr:O-antigen ligase family protein [Clostridium tepidiprofundi]